MSIYNDCGYFNTVVKNLSKREVLTTQNAIEIVKLAHQRMWMMEVVNAIKGLNLAIRIKGEPSVLDELKPESNPIVDRYDALKTPLAPLMNPIPKTKDKTSSALPEIKKFFCNHPIEEYTDLGGSSSELFKILDGLTVAGWVKWVKEIRALYYFRDTTVGLWATDKPNSIIDPNNLLFKIE